MQVSATPWEGPDNGKQRWVAPAPSVSLGVRPRAQVTAWEASCALPMGRSAELDTRASTQPVQQPAEARVAFPALWPRKGGSEAQEETARRWQGCFFLASKPNLNHNIRRGPTH